MPDQSGRSPSPVAFCDDDGLHPPHEGCRGVLHLPDCDRPWSQHPEIGGLRLCSAFLCATHRSNDE